MIRILLLRREQTYEAPYSGACRRGGGVRHRSRSLPVRPPIAIPLPVGATWLVMPSDGSFVAFLSLRVT